MGLWGDIAAIAQHEMEKHMENNTKNQVLSLGISRVWGLGLGVSCGTLGLLMG